MTDFKMNLRSRGQIINNKVSKPNKINKINISENPTNNNYTNIKSLHQKILEDNLIRKSGARGVGLAMAYACAGVQLYGRNCGCGR